MADQLQLRRGTTAQIASFTGAQGEIVVDTDKDTVVVQDGATAGGFPLATQTQVFNGTFYFNDDTGSGSTANSYILTPKANTNAPTQYVDGIQLGFTTSNANTGPSTATFSGLGVKSLKYRGGADPLAGDISGRVYLIYDQASDWFEIQRKAVAPPPQIRNVGASVAANALTATMPAQTVDFRGTPITNGTTTSIAFSSTLSIAAPSGATLGTTSGALSRIVVLALNNAGTVVLGLTNANNNAITFDETELVATTAISGVANSANVVYSAAGLSNVPYRVVGYIESTQATAGTWAASPSKIQGQGGQALILPSSRLVASAAQNTTSGTAVDFTGIPSWAKRITLNLNGVSTSGTNGMLLQVGSGSVDATGYGGALSMFTSAAVTTANTPASGIQTDTGVGATAASLRSGIVIFTNVSGNIWVISGNISQSQATLFASFGGVKTLAGALDRVRITSIGGTDTFDAGSANIMYEG